MAERERGQAGAPRDDARVFFKEVKQLKAEQGRLRAMLRSKEGEADQDEEEGSWLLTYADMVTLLLGIFVILFSLSTVDTKKYSQALTQIQLQLGGGTTPVPVPVPAPHTDAASREMPPAPELENLTRLMQRMEGVVTEMGLAESIELVADQRGVTLYALGGALFESGQAAITHEGQQFLLRITPLLQQVPNKVLVEGHTDDVPIGTDRFPSNWELSTARASSVVRLMIEEGGIDPLRFSASGYAHYHPRFDPTPENRAKNRRVEITILREQL
ncbi:MAG: OmpA family protein [Gammaproteobacteria bacterium]|nr:OmpA family protein [Gammaproteobacteria bacterium]